MNRKKLFAVALLVLALGFGLGAAVGSRSATVPFDELARTAEAQDTWTGTDEKTQVFNGSTLGSAVGSYPATICTATTGKISTMKALEVTSVTAGVIEFRSCADNTSWSSGTPLWTKYCVANTPYQLPETLLGEGLKTTARGYVICASGPGTVYVSFRRRRE